VSNNNSSSNDSSTATTTKKEFTCFKCGDQIHLERKPDGIGWNRMDFIDHSKEHVCNPAKVKQQPGSSSTKQSAKYAGSYFFCAKALCPVRVFRL
jgi:hypothetical protein